MKVVRLYFTALLCLSAVAAFAQEEKPADVLQIAEQEADRLQEQLKLEDWQTFYVDSTLKHDYQAMQEELNALSASRVSNSDMYQMVSDKWWDQIDATYRRIFTDEQWKAYLKSGGEKRMKARAKRKEKAEQALQKKK